MHRCSPQQLAAAKAPHEELDALFTKSSGPIQAAALRLAAARSKEITDTRTTDTDAAMRALGRAIGETRTIADLMGRARLLLESDAAADKVPADLRNVMVFKSPSPALGAPTFTDAVQAIIGREPRLARTGAAVAKVHMRGGFALARSADLQITKAIQRVMGELAKQSPGAVAASRIIAKVGNFTRAYAETVYRTNLSSAYSAGRWEQASDPVVAQVIGAFERVAILDGDARPWHAAAHGLIATKADPIWNVASTPSGYGCRCKMRLVSKFELESMGLLKDGKVTRRTPAGFGNYHPDKNFGGTPGAGVYAA